jgi:adenylate kinase family enzyme
MSAVQITGCSGAGKTTIAAVLVRRGLVAIDADDDPLLARSVDAAGNVVEEPEEPEEPDFAWLSQHSWAWNPARLDELIRAAAPVTLYVCGGADNELELADRFTQVFLLEIDEPTMLARVDARQDNDWGRIGDTREYLRRRLPELQDRLRAFGAIPIDARQPLDQVVDAVLSHTLANAAGRQWRLAGPLLLAPPRAEPASGAISPAVPPDPRNRQASPEGDNPGAFSWARAKGKLGGPLYCPA